MKNYRYSHSSQEKIDTLHDDLQKILTEAIIHSPVDFGVSQGARSFDLQLEYFLNGASKLDPRVPDQLARAKHVIHEDRKKAEAVDIYAYVSGRKDLTYDVYLLTLLAGHIMATAKRLFIEGKITHLLRWGGNWDRDGELITDQGFDDLPHYELIKP